MKVLFRRFVEDNIDFLARYLRRLGIPMSEIDDAIQEVLWVVHKKRAEAASRVRRARELFAEHVRDLSMRKVS